MDTKLYVNRITGEVLPFKTQYTVNPCFAIEKFGESKTVSTDFEPIRQLVNRIKKVKYIFLVI